MIFGFSVGDFLAAIELANKIRKEFIDAPSHFKAISDEYVSKQLINYANCFILGSEASQLSFKMPMLSFWNKSLTANKRGT